MKIVRYFFIIPCVLVMVIVGVRITKNADAVATCDPGTISVQAPFVSSISCLTDNTEIYIPDSQSQPLLFKYFLPPTNIQNSVYVKTPNTNIKDNKNLTWNITIKKTATMYIMPRKIPGINAPLWIRNGYTKNTNDDFTNLNQYLKRKNSDGLIGLYDIYSKVVNPGTITLYGAADSQNPAYSMYIVAITPSTNPPIPNPIQTNPPQSVGCTRPYSDNSPWNTPITNPIYSAKSASYIAGIPGKLGSTIDQYTYPFYLADASTPQTQIKLSGIYSNVTGPSAMTILSAPTISVTVPSNAVSATGTDANIIIWNQSTGDEWGFWQAHKNGNTWTAVNGYHYNTAWNAVPPKGFGSRGSGLPYFAGLVRPCEIKQGHIDHAIAFAYNGVSSPAVYPATKSDGGGSGLPEGARLQLDPSVSDIELHSYCPTTSCFIIAKALQRYGMYVIDYSGSTKIYPEYDATAHWNGLMTNATVNGIPLSKFKVIAW